MISARLIKAVSGERSTKALLGQPSGGKSQLGTRVPLVPTGSQKPVE